jgi:hypothetical protein
LAEKKVTGPRISAALLFHPPERERRGLPLICRQRLLQPANKGITATPARATLRQQFFSSLEFAPKASIRGGLPALN